MKIVINKCYGGFGLSDEGIEYYLKLKGLEFIKKPAKSAFREGDNDYFIKGDDDIFYDNDIKRDDEFLVKTVEDLGDDASDWASELKVVEIPDGTEWQIEEYDGREWVAEKHSTWE